MDWAQSWWLFAAASALGLVSGIANARRGTSGLSLLPWDFILLTCAVAWLATAAHLLRLWVER